jgi:hypothetical protein
MPAAEAAVATISAATAAKVNFIFPVITFPFSQCT